MTLTTLPETTELLEELVEVQDNTYSVPGRRLHNHRIDAIQSDNVHCNQFADAFSEWLKERYPASKFSDRAGEMFMAINEQVINVKEHGNQNDPSKLIYVRHYRVGQKVHVHVGREAPQENYPINKWFENTAPPPGVFPHKRGWGMKLTKEFTDKILVDTNGGGLVLIFELFPRINIKRGLQWQHGNLEWSQRLQIVPTKDGYNEALDTVEGLLNERVSGQCARRAHIGLTEALKNYCEHSQEWNPNGNVSLQFWKRTGGLYARIMSDGKGFNPREVAYTPELHGYGSAPDWFKSGREGQFGWGSMIISGTADLVLYAPNGKTLDLGFRLAEKRTT